MAADLRHGGYSASNIQFSILVYERKQNDPLPASRTPQLHDDALEEFDSSYRWDFRVIEGASSSSDFDSGTPPPLESEALPSAPETHTVFNDALRQKLKLLKVYAVVGMLVASL